MAENSTGVIGIKSLYNSLKEVPEGTVPLDNKIRIMNVVLQDVPAQFGSMFRAPTASLQELEIHRKEAWRLACNAGLCKAWDAIDCAISNAVQDAKGSLEAKYVVETAAKMFAESLLLWSFSSHGSTNLFMAGATALWNELRRDRSAVSLRTR